MKKLLSFIRKEQGFFLPYVMLIAILILIVITANIQYYRNDLQLVNNLTEQIRIETLFQMGYVKFLKEIEEMDEQMNGTVHYTFPYGIVSIDYRSLVDHQLNLNFNITTDTTEHYTIRKRIEINE